MKEEAKNAIKAIKDSEIVHTKRVKAAVHNFLRLSMNVYGAPVDYVRIVLKANGMPIAPKLEIGLNRGVKYATSELKYLEPVKKRLEQVIPKFEASLRQCNIGSIVVKRKKIGLFHDYEYT